MAKRLIAVLLILIMAMALISCGGAASSSAGPSAPASSGGQAAAPSSSTTAAPSAGSAAAPSGGSASAPAVVAPLKLGVYVPLSGTSAEGGIEGLKCIELAVKRINQNGGFNGAPLELVVYDTLSNSEESVKIVNKLVSVDKVSICLSSNMSGEILPSVPILNEAGVLTVATGNAYTFMQPDWPFVFRATVNNNYTTPVVAGMAKEVGYNTYSIFTTTDEAALTTTDSFQKEAEKLGFKLLSRQTAELADTEFAAQVAAIVKSDPDFVFLSTSSAATAHFCRQVRDAGYTGMLFLKQPFSTSNIKISGVQNSNYCAFAWPTLSYANIDDCDLPMVKEVLQLYLDAHGALPTSDTPLRFWDAMMILWEASKIAGSNDPEKMRQAANTISMQGLGGIIDFTDGKREAFSNLSFNNFVLLNEKNILWKDWINSGGFEEFKKATGHR